jgi:hypothetical protein
VSTEPVVDTPSDASAMPQSSPQWTISGRRSSPSGYGTATSRRSSAALSESTTLDPAQRRGDAERALELAQQAEIIESLPDDVEGLWRGIEHYDNMLAATQDQRKWQVLALLLQDAEDKFQQITHRDGLAAAD